MKKNLIFKPRARLLLQLGEQLIRNETIALQELVKNSYDADASLVSVIMKKVDKPEEGIIIIEDNGIGMDIDIIENVWMEIGSDYKEKLFSQGKRTKASKRLPLGEKGIGRFAVHKLGNEIELITRKKGNKEIYIKIDWNIFKQSKYLGEIPIEILEREPKTFTGDKTGTKIIIKSLKSPFTRGMMRELYRSINSLCSPFDSPESFRIKFEVDRKEWIKGILSWNEIKEYALYRFECEIEGQHITKFRYKFTPWPAMSKLRPREITEKDEKIKRLLKMTDLKAKPIDLNRSRIGKIKFEGIIFDRTPKILSLGVQDKKSFRYYLDRNGGVRVYRDGIRVYDYGEPGNDWLNLDIRRVNIPAKRISNNIIISAVAVGRKASQDLIEKTNREGFIENDAYFTFNASILYAIHIVEICRDPDKNKLQTYYGATSKTEPVISKINELRKVVKRKIGDKKLRDDIGKYIDRIESGYNYMNTVLLRSAGAGLGLSIVIHEVEKIVEEINKVIEEEKPSKRIVSLVKHLSNTIEGYTMIIGKSGRKKWDIKTLIDQALFNIEFRFKVHNIDTIKNYKNYNLDSKVDCARNLIIATIANIMDNSIWWLEYDEIKNKKIFVSISDDEPGYLSVIISDNGPGFSLSLDDITKPFVSGKPDGMGLGLHIAQEIMNAHGGKIIFPDPGEFDIPEEFKKGATVVLAFRKREGK